MVLDASLLNTQHYKVRIKGKVEQSREGVAPSPTHWCSSYRKGSLRVTLDYGRQLYFTYIHIIFISVYILKYICYLYIYLSDSVHRTLCLNFHIYLSIDLFIYLRVCVCVCVREFCVWFYKIHLYKFNVSLIWMKNFIAKSTKVTVTILCKEWQLYESVNMPQYQPKESSPTS